MPVVKLGDVRGKILNEASTLMKPIVLADKKLELAIIQVGNNDASTVYVRNKIRTCEKLGIAASVLTYPESVSFRELYEAICVLDASPDITGIMLQLPLPDHLKELQQELIDRISWWKDVDGLTTTNVGRLWNGLPCIAPATAAGIMHIFSDDMSGMNVTILGRSSLVGKPLAKLMMDRNATVTVCHSKTKGIQDLIDTADVIVSAIGKPNGVYFEAPNRMRAKVFVDVGINRDEDGKLCGDIDHHGFDFSPASVTDVPGGVGLLTTAQLAYNVVLAYQFGLMMEG